MQAARSEGTVRLLFSCGSDLHTGAISGNFTGSLPRTIVSPMTFGITTRSEPLIEETLPFTETVLHADPV